VLRPLRAHIGDTKVYFDADVNFDFESTSDTQEEYEHKRIEGDGVPRATQFGFSELRKIAGVQR